MTSLNLLPASVPPSFKFQRQTGMGSFGAGVGEKERVTLWGRNGLEARIDSRLSQ